MFKPKFTKESIKRHIINEMAKVETSVVNRMVYVGETFVRNARMNHTYKDQTGNLTASIGYMVLHNGQTKAESSVGPAQAQTFSAELKSRFTLGYALIVYAGMDYAASVESQGKDVLTASSTIAKKQLESSMRKFKKKLDKPS